MDLTATQSQAIQELSRVFTKIPFNHLLGLKLQTLKADHVVMTFHMKEELIGNFLHGILHGGVISSVLDMAGGMVIMADAIHQHPNDSLEELIAIVGKCSTIDLQISFLRPGRGELFTAKAWLTKGGKKISFTRMELNNQDDILIATANGTYRLK
jgi:uncharacterized protein (TIGR00369 family)